MAFSLAAAGGIIVLLGDMESEATYRVIGTTALTGAVSVAAFCGATLLGRRSQWFGIVTIGLSVITMALCLWFLWGDPYRWDGPWSETDGLSIGDIISQVLASSVLLTAVAAVSSLILLLTARTRLVRIGLPITLGFLVLGTCLVLMMIWVEAAWELEWLTRLNGIVWILAALGVVIVPLTSLLLRAGAKPADAGETTTGPTRPRSTPPEAPQRAGSTLSPSTLDRLDMAARAEGVTVDELVDRLLAAGSRTDPTTGSASQSASVPTTADTATAPATDSATKPDSHPRH
ncbi:MULTISPECIES: hypothetical protein [unclassified Brevibacterium]|uniref:hypothetical protein n=1 Tax=unclassified Brevibacterium TaxID=2614124 RepID=UPI0014368E5A|nr:hypothetical protein [Brevibacterium sp. S111]